MMDGDETQSGPTLKAPGGGAGFFFFLLIAQVVLLLLQLHGTLSLSHWLLFLPGALFLFFGWTVFWFRAGAFHVIEQVKQVVREAEEEQRRERQQRISDLFTHRGDE